MRKFCEKNVTSAKVYEFSIQASTVGGSLGAIDPPFLWKMPFFTHQQAIF